MLKLLIPAFLTVSAGMAAAGVHPDAGTTAFSFLRIGTGARPVAMGGAYTAVSDDICAIRYNPAGIAAFPEIRVTTGYRSLWSGGQAGFAGGTYPLEGLGSAGLLAVYERSGDMDKLDEDGNPLGSGAFHTGSFTITAAGAMRFAGVEKFITKVKYPQTIQLGGAVTFIQDAIDSYTSIGLAADVGVKYVIDLNKGLTFGGAVQNLGAQLTAYDTETAPLPLTFRAGVAYPLQYLPLLLAFDAVKPTDDYVYYVLGGEFTLTENLYLRAGFNTANRRDWHISDDEDTFVGLRLGAGFRMNNYGIDIAYTPSGQLGGQTRVSVSGTF